MFIHLVLQKLTCIANIYENIYIYTFMRGYILIVTRFAVDINDDQYSDNGTILT